MNLNEFSEALAKKGVNVQPIIERATTGEITGVEALSELMSLAVDSIPDDLRERRLAKTLDMPDFEGVYEWFVGMTETEILYDLDFHYDGGTNHVALAKEIYEIINQY